MHLARLERHGDPSITLTPLRGATVRERLEARISVDKRGCWNWQGSIASTGYGVMSVDAKLQYTHRLSYELHVGPIPDGLQIDHLCRNRACCNPAHLEPVTHRVNGERNAHALKTHCPQGHDYSLPENLGIRGTTGARYCKACNRERVKRAKAARRS